MWGAAALRRTSDGGDLYARIGRFLAEQRLDTDPANYAFAHAVLGGGDEMLAAEVTRLTDGGVRLTGADVARLGLRAGLGPAERPRPDPAEGATARLAEATAAQAADFAGMVRSMRQETRGFGRDLADSVAAITGEGTPASVADLARIARAMVRRVEESEARLARATDEAEALRGKLADARAAARQDPLTGLANRLGLAEAFATCGDGAGPHCLAVCDVDRFKAINDRHGHAVGDRVLRAISETLAQVCDGHLVARHGGEEFAVLLCGTPIARAAALIDDARAAVAAKRFRNRDTDVGLGTVTFSAGITALRAGEPAEEAFERADRLLYAAKAGGRDRTCAE